MYLRDFQITMRQHDFELYKRAREIWEPIELRIYRSIPKRFDFGGVKKVVVQVGPEPAGPEYQVLLGVGVFNYPDFDMQHFLKAEPTEQSGIVTRVIREAFSSLAERFGTSVPWVFDELARIEAEA